MLGVFFTEFLATIERRHGGDLLDDVTAAALPAGHRGYVADGAYDWRELAALVGAFAAATGVPVKSVWRGFGQHLFAFFAARHPDLLAACSSPFDLLLALDRRERPDLQGLPPGVELPRITARRTPSGLALHYRSRRPLGDLALGLIEGCLLHYATPGQVLAEGDGGAIRFLISLRQEETCPTRTIR